VPEGDDGNRGRKDLLVALGIRFRPTLALAIGVDARIPVWTHTPNGQLEVPIYLQLTLAGAIPVF
jgi:hypothetical protein